jgi:DNA-binding GntR family transcriptional regulator
MATLIRGDTLPIPEVKDDAVRRQLRKDEVFDRLFAAILDGTLVPGERIRDTDLQDWFGVSRTPIRLALDRLEEMRLIESRPNRFTRVSPAAPGRIPQLLEVMCALWVLGARLSLVRLDAPQLTQCRIALTRAAQACRDRDGSDAAEVVEAMRVALASLTDHCGNELLQSMVAKNGASLRYQLALQGSHLDVELFRRAFELLDGPVARRDGDEVASVFRRLRVEAAESFSRGALEPMATA